MMHNRLHGHPEPAINPRRVPGDPSHYYLGAWTWGVHSRPLRGATNGIAKVGRDTTVRHTCQMQQHVAFLHTSPVHVATFECLMQAADPAIKVEHAVHEDLLGSSRRVGSTDPDLVRRVHQAMRGVALGGASLVVCTCSTMGGSAESMPTHGRFTALRIDRAMADRAAQLGPRILVVAALESTLGPTADLIHESAAMLGTRVNIKPLLVDGAWSQFLSGDQGAYVQTIADTIRNAGRLVDVVNLAQASMAPAEGLLADLGVEVLYSPQLGVRSIMARLRA